MLFGVKLSNEIFPPWKDHYINYERLKKLLKENTIDAGSKKGKSAWTDHEESQFVAALDSELEKVYSFQATEYGLVNKKIESLEKQVEEINAQGDKEHVEWEPFQQELENALSEARELDQFARLNFTGFQKIVKKHDRLHPNYNSVKALLSIRLKELPFHSEDYSPLLNRISQLFQFMRDNLKTGSYISTSLSASLNTPAASSLSNQQDLDYQSFKFWVHPDNLMEVKTLILRHLPVLVYANETDDNPSADPIITSLYFDNSSFELYNMKLMKSNTSPSLRLRWYGKLSDKPDIFLEKKIVDKTDDENSRDIRLKLKEKYLNDFIINHDVEGFKQKTLQRVKEMGTSEQIINGISGDIDEVGSFISELDLQPALRSVYTRTAFQIPGDDRVRVTIDSDISFIREDAFDEDRPIRNPDEWHRTDIDNAGSDLHSVLRKNEFTKFPHAVMEIKIKSTSKRKASQANGISIPFSRKHGKWIEELTTSHLVKEVPNFSKFIQGIASLFLEDDRLDMLPFWLPELEDDIRMNPNQAIEEEKKKAKNQTDMKTRLQRIEDAPSRSQDRNAGINVEDIDHESSDDEGGYSAPKRKQKTEIIPFLTGGSKLANVDSEDEEVELPPGVMKPKTLLKQAGALKIEAKIWLANERTFNRWLHVCTLFSALTFAIYGAVKKAASETLATNMAYLYFFLTLFCIFWSYYIYIKRLSIIKERDGKHLDAPLGPMVITIGILVAIIVNFVSGFRHAAAQITVQDAEPLHPLIQYVLEKTYHLVGAEGY
ncbi:CYFA0S01e10660g1_1 [Cyberlindnera fabianii]|uniref:CYFA0S01e10660g1_1 n=1 Tax=Cyberlindnera fabianii TaxID=36022 RepID=A0A061AJY2_CYBFA|nr:CYFA0S01e10660g1_1 [Cyberlindnera fabianii]